MEKLTIKELKFVEEYVNSGFNGAKSYRIAYETDNTNLAKAEAWKMLRKPKIQAAISQTEQSYKALAREMEMDKKRILLEIRKVIKGDNAKEKLSAITTLCKLTGDFAPEKKEVQFDYEPGSNIDLSKLGDKELIELRDKLLSEM